MKVIDALKNVPGEDDDSVEAIMHVLRVKRFSADDPANGAFCHLSESKLERWGLDDRQVCVVLAAQKNATRGRSAHEEPPGAITIKLVVQSKGAKDAKDAGDGELGKKPQQKLTTEDSYEQLPTFPELQSRVEQEFEKRFAREDFCLKIGSETVTSEKWQMLARKSLQNNVLTIGVVSLCKPFSDFQHKDIVDWLGITGGVAEASDLYKPPELLAEQTLAEHITKMTGWKTIQDVMDHLGKDLAARAAISCPQDHTMEESCRELVSPLLMAAVICASKRPRDFQMHAEFHVRGLRAFGCIDWVMVYEEFKIVVVEAKLFNSWRKYQGQLAAEMVGSVEDFVINTLQKRKADAAQILHKVPTWGVLTNGLSYKFYKFVEFDDGRKGLQVSTTQALSLTAETDAAAAQASARPIVAFLASILLEQQAMVDGTPDLKRPRVDARSTTEPGELPGSLEGSQ